MSEKRRDKKGRILRNGECQRKDGMYQFDYVDLNGKPKCVYSWKLEPTDPLPKGKRNCLSLREKEKEIIKSIDAGIVPAGGGYTVIQLATEHVSKIKLKISTRQVYQYKLNAIGREDFANTRIDKVRTADIKQWYKKMKERGVSYGTICGTHRLLCYAFQSAVEDDLLPRNPFNFRLNKVIENDTKSKEAITPETQKKFLNFVKNNNCYYKHYNVLCILLATGVRVSELCGLTLEDIDLEQNEIHITKQIQRITGRGSIITTPKSDKGTRVLPITDEVKRCFEAEIQKRAKLKKEPVILDEKGNEYQGFIFLSTRGNPKTAANFDSTFRNIVAQYNKTYPSENFAITPHVCRHTYSTNYAGQTEKMNPKHLQYLMGHARVETTLNIYTHVNKSNVRRDIETVDVHI